MVDYQKLYTMMFNRITDAIELIDKLKILEAKEILITAQQAAEEMHIESDDKV